MHQDIATALKHVRTGIADAADGAGRPADSVRLVAVSKTHPADAIRTAFAAGQLDFGENYAQELEAKLEALADIEGLRFHFIGPLQSNKVKLVAARATLIHTADRDKVVRRIASVAQVVGTAQRILFEVHLSPETSKAGCRPDDLPGLLELALSLDGLKPVGLMTMPPYVPAPEAGRPYFVQLRKLLEECRARFDLPDFDQLSMGMSHDYAVAIQEGATIVRVGTAIFGSRG